MYANFPGVQFLMTARKERKWKISSSSVGILHKKSRKQISHQSREIAAKKWTQKNECNARAELLFCSALMKLFETFYCIHSSSHEALLF